MADQLDIPVKDEKKEELPQAVSDHKKSFEQVISEIQKEKETPVVETPKEEPKVEPVVPEPVKEEPKVEPAAPTPEEIAKKTADEMEAREKAARERLLAEEKAKEDAERLKKELRPKWEWDEDPRRQKDPQTGKPLPFSYEETTEEGARIGRLSALQEIEKREAERAKQADELKQQQQKQADDAKKQAEDAQAAYQQEIERDLDDLYASDKLPKIKDPNNPNDEGVLAKAALFKKGMEINQALHAAGKPPIRSIKLIYYEHYTAPTKQPAGANAPIAGNTQPPASKANEPVYNFAKEHGKGWGTFLKDTVEAVKSVKGK